MGFVNNGNLAHLASWRFSILVTRYSSFFVMPIEHKDVTWIEEPEFGFWEASFLPAVAAGLRTTIDHITLNRPVTQQYPEVKPQLPEHYRGVHRLNRDEQGRVNSGVGMLCATACPANCI